MGTDYDVSALADRLKVKAHELFNDGTFKQITITCQTVWGCSVTYESNGDPDSPYALYMKKKREEQELENALQANQREAMLS